MSMSRQLLWRWRLNGLLLANTWRTWQVLLVIWQRVLSERLKKDWLLHQTGRYSGR
ncbi:uncharacterized protein MYCFIDRAFT_211153 [Pseudocercospora fijiensis CIRAD86]|uniref:Uncharacterized protein n=1 Tax=Pseudocercospora fijiensis (strain CIRAD86) TaxID=383855 RepID=M3AE16_PSEFD|nr:uncharacterized protein MYCFIDRAFT_211153 [Pseudocercospora fijiensis CIRAD86]EME82776.1 hypothetical protein MYCFIDRAFT_211153 [Pseudocercospora fijiensis CIRAD86]